MTMRGLLRCLTHFVMIVLLLLGLTCLIAWPLSHYHMIQIFHYTHTQSEYGSGFPRSRRHGYPLITIDDGRAAFGYRYHHTCSDRISHTSWSVEFDGDGHIGIEDFIPLFHSRTSTIHHEGCTTKTWWGTAPLPVIAASLLIWPIPWFVMQWQRRARYRHRLASGLCPACGYDLRGTSTGVCSECGAQVVAAQPH